MKLTVRADLHALQRIDHNVVECMKIMASELCLLLTSEKDVCIQSGHRPSMDVVYGGCMCITAEEASRNQFLALTTNIKVMVLCKSWFYVRS